MNKHGWIVVVGVLVWALLPTGIAGAVVFSFYVNCSTGVSPFTFTTVTSNSSEEQQVFCNEGDTALGGGVELENPPPPKGVIITTPENSFHFTGETADGWQVVLQNINLAPGCLLAPSLFPTLCPSVSFRVCVSCFEEP